MYLKSFQYNLYWKRNCFIDSYCIEDLKFSIPFDTCETLIECNGEYLSIDNNFNAVFSGNKHEFIVRKNGKTLTFESKEYLGRFLRHRCRRIRLDEFKQGDKFFQRDKLWIPVHPGFNVAWLCPYPIKNSGGIRTLLNMAIASYGNVDIWVKVQKWEKYNLENVISLLKEYVSIDECKVFLYRKPDEIPDIYNKVYCTNPYTSYDCIEVKLSRLLPFNFYEEGEYTTIGNKILFMQDTEWIDDFKISTVSVDWLKRSYALDLSFITMSRYLEKVVLDINKEIKRTRLKHLDFTVNEIYYNSSEEREKSVCVLYQPEKRRRDPQFTLKVIEELSEKGIHVIIYGGRRPEKVFDNCEYVGVLTPEECAKLYRKCKVGFLVQCSNPSRIPFEMVSCGLNVCTTNTEGLLENLKYDTRCGFSIVEPCEVVGKIVELLDTDHIVNNCINREREENVFRRHSEPIVSCDLFDTLVTRKECQFDVIDMQFPGFKSKRLLAEKLASEASAISGVDYTLDDIYNNFEDGSEFYKMLEIQVDMEVIVPIQRRVDWFNSLKCKKIIITEMYYPKNVVEKILESNGIHPDILFVSSNEGKNKCTGLIDIVLGKMNALPDQVIHFGDRKDRDGIPMRNAGISTYILPKDFSFLHGEEVEWNLVISEVSEKTIAPLLLEYVKWCYNICIDNKLQKMLFCSRDGYILWKIAKQLEKEGMIQNVELIYFYNSRQIVHPLTLEPGKFIGSEIIDGSLKWIIHRPEGILTMEMISRRLFLDHEVASSLFPQEKMEKNLTKEEVESVVERLVEKKNDFVEHSLNSCSNVKKYMDQYLNDPVLIVDSGWFGNMIHSIREIYKDNHNIHAAFVSLFEYKNVNIDDRNYSWIPKEEKRKYPIQQMFEIFLSIDNGTVIGIDEHGNPVENSPEIGKIKWGIRLQMRKILEATEKLLDVPFKGMEEFHRFCKTPTKREAYVYGMFPYSSDQTDMVWKRMADEGSSSCIWHEAHRVLNGK